MLTAREARRGLASSWQSVKLGSEEAHRLSSASATPGAPRKGLISFERAGYRKNGGNVPQFRGAHSLTGDRDTLATAPAQGQEERLGMGLSFPPIFLR